MIDSLTYIRDNHPDVYERTKYRIIEISKNLADGQKRRAAKAGLGAKVEVINEDFFGWEGGGVEPCYVVALEVLVRFHIVPILSPLTSWRDPSKVRKDLTYAD